MKPCAFIRYVADDKPPPSEYDDNLLDMMIRDGDFTKGFYPDRFIRVWFGVFNK